MKKLIAVILCLVMVLMMAGCGNKADSSSNASTEKKVLRVGMECGYAPYNWTQTDASNGAVKISDGDGYAYGYDVMMAKYLADKMGYELEIYKIEWTSLPVAVNAGTIDCIIAGQSITSEAKETLDFTKPYYYASIVCLTKSDSKFASAKGISDLKGAKATSQLNTVWYKTFIPQIPGVNKLPAMEDVPAMLVALNSGKCDVVVTDAPTAMGALVAYPQFKVLDFSNSTDKFNATDEDVNIGISVKKGNTELLNKLDAALDLTKDDFIRMMTDATKVQPLAQK